ncbi:hypothetical protein EJ04DRAFT_511962 [Polyplosphaeria fusca]|uniref:Autophagy-related protein 29 n=1 Tax=Polyplosphaeria fusca TaxID=682080 RepID=A0A9P4R1K0_9PLEO|nr:hypothetical protein EJ04DRAFT_511962 [Polyplosphaeria fusca]
MATERFTVLLRLPFTRGDFVDPPYADWNEAKDRALWRVISKSSKTSDLDWVELALRFEVPPTFLLQQAAWLYERHLDHVRSQMKKVGGATVSATSTSHSNQSALGGIPMQRGGSNGSRNSQTPSALSTRTKDGPMPRGENSTPSSTIPPLSRTPSTNTITQSRAYTQQGIARNPSSRLARPTGSGSSQQIQPATLISPNVESESGDANSEAAPESSSTSSSSDSDVENPIHRSQLFKRPPRFQRAQKPRDLHSYDEENDDQYDSASNQHVVLPFAKVAGEVSNTNADASKRMPDEPIPHRNHPPPIQSMALNRKSSETSRGQAMKMALEKKDASSSLASSASDAPVRPGPLSPRHRSDLARQSPARMSSKGKREGSEGTPSMGSSFSDIDDAGISQSALEEALLSNIQHGRMSTLSHFRSRYL